MSTPSLSTVYTTQSLVEKLLSVFGVKSRLDDDNDGVVDDDEQERLTECIEEASETVNAYLYAKYDPSRLAQSVKVKHIATAFAAMLLCETRGLSPHEALEKRCEKYEEYLEKVSQGKIFLPNTPLRRNQACVWDNVRCDPRMHFRVIRQQRRSSSREPTARPQVPDYQELYTFEI